MVRVMRCHRRGAAVVRSHHFRGIGSRRSAQSHSLTQQPENERWEKQKQSNDGEEAKKKKMGLQTAAVMEREAVKISGGGQTLI